MKQLNFLILMLLSTMLSSQFDLLNLSEPRSNITSVLVGDSILFVGGSDELAVDYLDLNNYNLTSGEYSDADGNSGSRAIQNERYTFFYNLFGVNTALRDHYKFDRQTSTWSGGKNPFNSSLSDGYIIENKVYLYDDFDYDKMSVFNLSTDEWTEEDPVLDFRRFSTLDTEDYLFCVNGRAQSGNVKDIKVYDKKTKEWSSYESTYYRGEPSLVFHKSKLIMYGGSDNSRNIELLNIEDGTIELISLDQRYKSNVFVKVGNKIILAGDDLGTAAIINLDNLSVEEIPLDNKDNRKTMRGTSIDEYGYFTGFNSGYDWLHIYNSKNNSWDSLRFSSAREDVSLISADQKLFIAGGETVNGPTDQLLVLDTPSISIELGTSTLNVYPNPTHNYLNIISDNNESYSSLIYDTQGNLVLKSSNEKQVDVSALPTGMYYLKLILNSNQEFKVTKIIKN